MSGYAGMKLMQEPVKALERENKELRRANEILKLASTFFCPSGAGSPIQVLRDFIDKHRDAHGVEPICGSTAPTRFTKQVDTSSASCPLSSRSFGPEIHSRNRNLCREPRVASGTRLERLKNGFKDNRFVAAILLVAAVTAGVAGVPDSLGKLDSFVRKVLGEG